MQFNLSRQNQTPHLYELISKEVKRQKIYVMRATKKHLKEIRKASLEIRRKRLPSCFVQKQLKKGLGQGIFLHPEAKPILKGQVIAPYSGLVSLVPQSQTSQSDYIFALLTNIVLTKEEQGRFDPKNTFHPRRLYSLDLDAKKQGNFTRFINHSEKPNIEALAVRIDACPLEIVYFASKTIHPGEQLLVSYEDEEKSYWGASGITPLPIFPKTFRLNTSFQVLTRASNR